MVFGNTILTNPALFNQPRFSVEIIETPSDLSTEECLPEQETDELSFGSGGSQNQVVVSTVSDVEVDDCVVNGGPAQNCRVFTYEVDQNRDGGSPGPALTSLSFELPSCINADNFLDFVAVAVDSAPVPFSALSVTATTKIGTFGSEVDIFILTVDLDGFTSPGTDFFVDLIYDASFFVPIGFPLLDVVNPFDYLVQVSSNSQTLSGFLCGPSFCSPQPSPPPSQPSPPAPPSPPPSPPQDGLCIPGDDASTTIGPGNQVTVTVTSSGVVGTCEIAGVTKQGCQRFCYLVEQMETGGPVSPLFWVGFDVRQNPESMILTWAGVFVTCAHIHTWTWRFPSWSALARASSLFSLLLISPFFFLSTKK